MAHRQATESKPICPTCESDLTGRKEFRYFASDSHGPNSSDDISDFYEETNRLVGFLGALAQAGPQAVAVHFNGIEDATNDYTPEWVTDFSWLVEELTKEAKRRLRLLNDAGRIWQSRAEEKTVDKKKG